MRCSEFVRTRRRFFEVSNPSASSTFNGLETIIQSTHVRLTAEWLAIHFLVVYLETFESGANFVPLSNMRSPTSDHFRDTYQAHKFIDHELVGRDVI